MNLAFIFKKTKHSFDLNIPKTEAEKILQSKMDLVDGNIFFPHYVFGNRGRMFTGFFCDGNFKLKSNGFHYRNSLRPIVSGKFSEVQEQNEKVKSRINIDIQLHIFFRIILSVFAFIFVFGGIMSAFGNLLTGLTTLLFMFIVYGVFAGFYSYEEDGIIKSFKKIYGLYIVDKKI